MTGMQTNDAALAALAGDLGRTLSTAGLRLALAESCTGGWIAKVVTDIAGSSTWFERGFVSYSNEAKIELLGVPAEVLTHEGAVSEAVVRLMAEGALQRSRADVAIAVSGIAGPGGGSAQKPVGMVCFAWSRLGSATVLETVVFPGDREAVRRQTAGHALQRLTSLLDSAVE